jgi:hypothetical protein
MGVSRVAIKKLMDSFGLHFDFLPEKKISRDYGITYCNVVNMYKGEMFKNEFRICNIRIKPGVWEPIRGNKDILIEKLNKTIFAYLGVEDVADELMEMSQEYSEELIRKGHFDD